MVQFGEVIEPLGGAALLEEGRQWEVGFKNVWLYLLPVWTVFRVPG